MDAAGGSPQPGVTVTLLGARRDGSDRTTERVVSDRRGRYRFEDLSPGHVYAVQAVFEGGLFAGSPIRLPASTDAAPVVDSTLRVWPTTMDPGVIAIERDAIFLAPSGEDLGVIESVVVTNSSRRAYIGRGGSMDSGGRDPGRTPTLGFSLPAQADKSSIVLVDASWDGPPPVATDFGFGTTVAIPPGETSTTFSYRATGSGGVFDASRTALYPTSELVVHAVKPLVVEGNRLVADGAVRVAGRTYRRWTSQERIEAGNMVQISATARAGLDTGMVVAGIAAAIAALAAGGWWARARRRSTGPPAVTSVTAASSSARTQAAHSGSGPAPSSPAGGSASPPSPGVSRPSREEIIAQVAALDLEHGAGRVGDEEWRRKRQLLLGQLGEASSERTP